MPSSSETSETLEQRLENLTIEKDKGSSEAANNKDDKDKNGLEPPKEEEKKPAQNLYHAKDHDTKARVTIERA